MGSASSNSAAGSNNNQGNSGIGGNSSNSSGGSSAGGIRGGRSSLPISLRGRRSSASAVGQQQQTVSAGATAGAAANHAVAEMSSPTSAAGGADINATNLALNRPYTMTHRIATDDTQLLQGPSISRNGTGLSNPGGLASMSEDGGSEGGAARLAAAIGGNPTNLSGFSTPAATTGGSAHLPSRPALQSPLQQRGPSGGPSVNKTTGGSSILVTGNVGLSTNVQPVHCLNPASEVNSRLDTQVEVRVYPCNNNSQTGAGKKKFTQFNVKPEGVIIQGTNRHRAANNDLGAEYAMHVGRKLQRYELSDTRACQLLVTTHNKSFWVVPAPEAFSRHSGTCRLLGDRKHQPASHTLQVGDFLRVGSVGVVVIETHDGVENRILSEEKIQKIMKDTTSNAGGFLDLAETDGENSDDSSQEEGAIPKVVGDEPVCYMCFDEEDTPENPMITPCKCLGDTRFVHVDCLRKWHTAEADNQVCFLSSVDATCSVCKSTFRSDFKLKDGRLVKLFKSSLEPPYVSLLVATKHEMAQRLFNTRFQLSFSTLIKPDRKNGTRPLLLGRSSGSDMVLDYRTVSARHATIRFKNGEFIFTDAGSSNGSYLYLRRPVELTASQSVQFRLGRSMISMKVVNKWNRRLLRAVSRRTGFTGTVNGAGATEGDDHSVGSNEDDVRITDNNGSVTRTLPRRTRESIMGSLPPCGGLAQASSQHMDLLYALAYPKRVIVDKDTLRRNKASVNAALPPPMEQVSEGEGDESKFEGDPEVQVVSSLEEVINDFDQLALDDDSVGEESKESEVDVDSPNGSSNDVGGICAETVIDSQEETVVETGPVTTSVGDS